MKHFMLVEYQFPIGIDRKCIIQFVNPKTKCPACLKRGYYRTDVGFEDEMMCGDCNLIWEPFMSYLMIITGDEK